MKKSIARVALSTMLISGALFAGKNVAPVESEVVPVANMNPFYVGIGGVWALNSRKCQCQSTRLKDNSVGYIIRAGFDINRYLGIEGRYLKSKWNNNYAEVTHYGAYLKPQYYLNESMNIYGLIGYGNTNVRCSHKDITKDYNINGVALGAGIEYDIHTETDGQGPDEKGVGVWLDYTNLLHHSNNGTVNENINANIVTAGVTYDF